MTETNPRRNVMFDSNGGHAHGYLAKPPSGSGPGLVVIQEWGPRPHLRHRRPARDLSGAVDPVVEARQQEQQIREQSKADVECCYYPADHSFHNDTDQIGTYDAESAKQAWQRTIEFLKANVR